MTASASPDLAPIHAYLPSTLIERCAAAPERSPVWAEWLEGTLMHCDVTGFTAMSEGLAGLGKEGAELMAGVLNAFFERMLTIADARSGVQMKFGGDAMMLFFAGNEGAVHGVSAGIQMQAAMDEFSDLRLHGQHYSLRMRVGLHSGRFLAMSTGKVQGDGPLHYLLTGGDVNRAAAVEPLAQPGEVVVSAQTASLISSFAQIERAPGDVFRVLDIVDVAPPDAPRRGAADGRLLERYIVPPIAEMLRNGSHAAVAAEHRRVTAVFITLDGVSHLIERSGAEAALEAVDAYMNALLAAVDRHGGVLSGSDVSEHGDKLIVLFGAPISQERAEASALRCALEIDDALRDAKSPLTHQIGINTGPAFAGEIGSARRREYTVIGDAVNLAARLMAAGKAGEILVSEATATRAGVGFAFRGRRPIQVKGKRAPVRFRQLVAVEHDASADVAGRDAPMAGRAVELRRLVGSIKPAKSGPGTWSFVTGAAGSGKTRLVEAATERAASQGIRVIRTECQPHSAGTPFAPWARALRALLEIDERNADAKGLTQAVRRLAPDQAQFAPLVAAIVGVRMEEDAFVHSLDARARRERLIETVVALFARPPRGKQTLLVFEDVHHADDSSLELINAVLQAHHGDALVWATSRDSSPPRRLAGKPIAVRLGRLSTSAARALVRHLRPVSEEALQSIVQRGSGNPLFLRELARREASTGGELPESINDVVLARIDQLPGETRRVLGLAAVAGATFDRETISELLDPGTERVSALDSALDRLTQIGFVRRSGRATFAFEFPLAREVAYETLLYARRRDLHRTVAARIERTQRGRVDALPEVLFHYEAAGETGKVVHYGALCGDGAAALFANTEAIGYYERAIGALEREQDARGDRCVVLERIADCHETSGRHREAMDTYVAALGEWRGAGRAKRPRFLAEEFEPAREAVLCRKIGVTRERRSEFDEALQWLEDAARVLPARAALQAAQISAARSVTLMRKGEYGEAIEWGRKALSTAQRSGDARVTAYAHNMLATSYIERGELKRAVPHLERAVALYERIGDFPGQAAARNNLGSCLQLLGRLPEAKRHYKATLEIDERIGNRVHAAIIHNNLGEVLLATGDFAEAVKHLEGVLLVQKERSELAALAGLAHVNLARCRAGQHRYRLADGHLRHAIALLRKVGAKGMLLEATIEVAELRLEQKKTADAVRIARQQIARAKELDVSLLEARAGRVLGAAMARQGKVEEGRAHLLASAALARHIGAGLEEGRAIVETARIELAREGAVTASTARSLARAATLLQDAGARAQAVEAGKLVRSITKAGARRARVTSPRRALRDRPTGGRRR